MIPHPSRTASRPAALAIAALALCLGMGRAGAQTSGDVTLDSSEQIFDVLAALNAAGYNTGADSGSSDDTRHEVRRLLAAKNIPVAADIAKFYREHQIKDDPGADLGQFISLALLIGPPPDFKLQVNSSDLPPDAKSVEKLLPLLRRFYQQADLQGLWVRVQPREEEARAPYVSTVRRDITLSDAYLRFPAGSYLGRSYHIYICLLGAPEETQARIYGESYYLVITPAQTLKFSDIRHQYLHFLLDPLAVKYAAEMDEKHDLIQIARKAPALSDDFKDDFSLLMTECLIKAVELRMDKPKDAAQQVNQLEESGLILTRYFYEALADYQKQDAPISVYYKQMIQGIDVAQEQEDLAKVHFSPPPAPKILRTTPQLSAEEQLLTDASNLVYQGKYLEAREKYEQVLEKYDAHSERALYGMAVVSSNTRKPDTAEKYFKQTLAVARDTRIVTWSHIYLGRLYDLESRRDEALAQYRASALTAPSFPNAVRAVQDGLRYPFGTKH